MNLEKLNKIEEKLFDVLADSKLNVRDMKIILRKMLDDVDNRSVLKEEVIINIKTLTELSGKKIMDFLEKHSC